MGAVTASWPRPAEVPRSCAARALPVGSRLDVVVERAVLQKLDRTACAVGATPEELLLATASDEDARAFEREHGVDPRRATTSARAARRARPGRGG